jgi:uncharacterized membrane protein YoaK (UPF0700 family)
MRKEKWERITMNELDKQIAEQEGRVQSIDQLVSHAGGWSTELVRLLSLSILFFTLCTLILVVILLYKKDGQGTDAYGVLRIFGIILIISISALLLVVGYSSEQLTPIIGLFGAIAGYLLGKEKKET